MSEGYENLKTPWKEMSYRKYSPISQHKRLAQEYEDDRQSFKIEQLEVDDKIEYEWGGW